MRTPPSGCQTAGVAIAGACLRIIRIRLRLFKVDGKKDFQRESSKIIHGQEDNPSDLFMRQLPDMPEESGSTAIMEMAGG